jgi:serine/threonine protein phosphatase PrpC
MSKPVSEVDGAVVCPECGFEALPGESFCENCSAPLLGPGASPAPAASPDLAVPVPRPCTNCGGTAYEDGYCSTCGAPAVSERDHWSERPAPWVAAVSDRGLRHHRNEDAMAVSATAETGSRAVLVVCDGVSSSADPDIASLGAARAARDVLDGPGAAGSGATGPGAGTAGHGAGTAGAASVATVDAGAAVTAAGWRPTAPSVAGRITEWTERITEAAAAANEMAVEAARRPSGRPGERDSSPSCTFVVGVVDSGPGGESPLVVAGWVGDSRAYWLPDGAAAELLTVDDSWASEQILSGVARDVAESSPQAHAITRWLGSDSPDFTPRCSSTVPAGPGWLLVCSDGLWNYCSPPADMGALVARVASDAGGDPARVAEELVTWANAQGGMDNITVALARF